MAPTATVSASSQAAGALSAEQLEKFRKDGYLILPDFFDPKPILAHAKHLIHQFDPKDHPMTKFTTGDSVAGEHSAQDHVGDRYFLTSGDKIRYFLEEGSIGADGKLNRAPDLSINKCGHGTFVRARITRFSSYLSLSALHALDPVLHKLSFDPRVQNVVRSLEQFQSPRVLQSMVICKQPSIGGAVPSHNDSTFLYTDPPTAVGLWFALEDCTKSNGCLSFMPGSHRWPKDASVPENGAQRPQNDHPSSVKKYGVPRGVNRRFVRADPGNEDRGTAFETIAQAEEDTWDEERAVVGECKAGAYDGHVFSFSHAPF